MKFPPLVYSLIAVAVISPPALAQFSFTERGDLLSESSRSGAPIGIADMNGDGLDDLVRLDETVRLLIDYQGAPGAPFTSHVHGVLPRTAMWALCIADVDRNGFNDIFAGPSGGGILLLKADATGSSYSVEELPNRNIFVQGSIFADIDNDGNVDIFATDDNEDNHRYRNDGAGGFTLEASLIDTSLPSGSSGNYAALWTDYNNDGHRDLYLSKCRGGVNDASDPRRINRLFKNDGANAFSDVGPAVGLADGAQSWCADFADIDNDGDLDCFILNHGTGSSKLLENDGSGDFTNITAGSGLSGISYYGIQALFRDFDNDGFIDLFVCASDLGGASATYRLYRNNGDRSFTSLSNVLVSGGPISHLHSCALGDLNHDGFVDIFGGRGEAFNTPSDNLRDLLFLNNGNSNHFLGVQLKGRMSNPNAIGARLELHGAWGVQLREVRAGEGYGIQNSLSKIFGLGATTTITKLVVKWPSGITEEFLAPAADQYLVIREGDTLEPGDFSAPVIASSLTTTAETGSALGYRIAADHLALSYAISNGPAGMTVDPDSGILSWTPATAGVVTVGLMASNPAGTDRKTLTITVEDPPPPPDFSSAINNSVLVFATSDDSWFEQDTVTRDGEAIQSGNISDNGLSFVETIAQGPGELEFWWRVSSEGNFDILKFKVDGQMVEEISGSGSWELVSYTVGAGEHRLRWEYDKDSSVSEGSDAGYLDQISYLQLDGDGDGLIDDWEIANFGDLLQSGEGDGDRDGQSNLAEQMAGTDPNDPESVLRILSLTRQPGGTTEIVFQSVAGKKYVIEGAGQLTDFQAMSEVLPASGASTTKEVASLVPGSIGPVSFVSSDAPAKIWVPLRDLNGVWRGGEEADFQAEGGDGLWTAGPLGVGYDQNSSNYDPFIGTDLQTEMYQRRASAFVRVPFTVTNAAEVTSLTLRVRYDDGFAAWLNGVKVADDNAIANPNWQSAATATRQDNIAVGFADFDLTPHLGSLRSGDNILALQGLNRTTNNRDFLLQPELVGEQGNLLETDEFYFRVRVVE